jgi:SHS2 domain-containing protein
MPYSYLEHEADVGLHASGHSFEAALEAGVQGMLDLMVDTSTVRTCDSTPVTAAGRDPGSLFVALLNAVLAERDITGQFFGSFRVDRLSEHEGQWKVAGTLFGEPADLDRHSTGNEIKAATYSGLRFTDRDGVITFRCVLDI